MNISLRLKNSGYPSLGTSFQSFHFLTNGSTITKQINLEQELVRGAIQDVEVQTNYYPNYGLIEKTKVCSIQCPAACAEISGRVGC